MAGSFKAWYPSTSARVVMSVERCNACKSCTHVEESNPGMMHDKFRGPLDFPGRGTGRAAELDRFQSAADQKNDVAASGVHRDGANNNTQRPRHLLMWPQSLEWCLALCVPKWNPWNYRHSRDPSSKNYFSSLTHFSFFFYFSSFFSRRRQLERRKTGGIPGMRRKRERGGEKEWVREGWTVTAHLQATSSVWPLPLSLPLHPQIRSTGGEK